MFCTHLLSTDSWRQKTCTNIKEYIWIFQNIVAFKITIIIVFSSKKWVVHELWNSLACCLFPMKYSPVSLAALLQEWLGWQATRKLTKWWHSSLLFALRVSTEQKKDEGFDLTVWLACSEQVTITGHLSFFYTQKYRAQVQMQSMRA